MRRVHVGPVFSYILLRRSREFLRSRRDAKITLSTKKKKKKKKRKRWRGNRPGDREWGTNRVASRVAALLSINSEPARRFARDVHWNAKHRGGDNEGRKRGEAWRANGWFSGGSGAFYSESDPRKSRILFPRGGDPCAAINSAFVMRCWHARERKREKESGHAAFIYRCDEILDRRGARYSIRSLVEWGNRLLANAPPPLESSRDTRPIGTRSNAYQSWPMSFSGTRALPMLGNRFERRILGREDRRIAGCCWSTSLKFRVECCLLVRDCSFQRSATGFRSIMHFFVSEVFEHSWELLMNILRVLYVQDTLLILEWEPSIRIKYWSNLK